MSPLRALCPVVLVFAVSFSAYARADIVGRHDRDDAAYVSLGAAYPAVAKLGGRMGDGTLVAPEWVLTAAHVADGMLRRDSRSVVLQGREHQARDFYIHPEWTQMGPHDVALIRLAAPVEGIAPLPFYEGRDEAGLVATLVGHGRHGNGLTGPTGEDGQRRAATNRIESADQQYLVFQFDEGDAATDLEGIPSGGDSGGPAVVEVGGARYVAGVSSLGRPGRNGPGTYGALDYFGRVSTYLSWLRDAQAGRARPVTAPAAAGPGRGVVRRPGGSARDLVIRAVVDALRGGAEPQIEQMVREHFAPALQDPSRADALRTTLREISALIQKGGDLDLRMGGGTGGVDMHVLAAGSTLGVIVLELTDEPTPKVRAISLRGSA